MRFENHEAKNFTTQSLMRNHGQREFITSNPIIPSHPVMSFKCMTTPSANTATIAGRINIRTTTTPNVIFTVADGATATDLLVSAAITQWSAGAGFTKNGTGTMALTGNNTSPCHTFARHDRFLNRCMIPLTMFCRNDPNQPQSRPHAFPAKSTTIRRDFFRQPL
jgi:hypothetical protein